MDDFDQLLLPPTIIENIVHFLGIFGNLNIILATIQSKQLRNSCNLLIAMQAIFDLCGEFGGLVDIFTVYVTDDLFVDSYVCFYLQLIPGIAINMSTSILLMIGIDRVISIKFAVSYSKFNSTYYYRLSMLLPGILINSVIIPIAYIGNFSSDSEPEICLIGRLYPPVISFYYIILLLVIYISAIIVYVYMMYLVKTLTSDNNASLQITKKIEKSIVIIVCVTIGGWLIGTGYTFVTFFLMGDSTESNFVTSRYFDSFTYLGMAASYYIYFYNSIDYRQAFVSIWRNNLCCWIMPKQSAIIPLVAVTSKNSRSTPHL